MLKTAEQLLNYRDEDVTLDRPAEIRKQSAIADAEEPERELKDRAMAVLKFTEQLRPIGTGINVFEGTDSNEQCTETAGKVIVRILACCGEILKEK